MPQRTCPQPPTLDVANPQPLVRRLTHWVPNEHGFWVMAAAAIIGALLRAGATASTLGSAFATLIAAAASGGLTHRMVRKRAGAQLAATALLGLLGVPIELAGGLPLSHIAAATLARSVVFVTSALVVRAAFARLAKGGAARSGLLHAASIAIALSAALLLGLLQHMSEAWACFIASSVYVVFACSRPTAKQLRPLGLTLGGLALVSALVLAL